MELEHELEELPELLVLAGEAPRELCLAPCRGRIRVETDHLDPRYPRRTDGAASPVTGAAGDHDGPCSVRPRQVKGGIETVARTVQHHDRIYAPGHALLRPDEPARRCSCEGCKKDYQRGRDITPTFTSFPAAHGSTPFGRRLARGLLNEHPKRGPRIPTYSLRPEYNRMRAGMILLPGSARCRGAQRAGACRMDGKPWLGARRHR